MSAHAQRVRVAVLKGKQQLPVSQSRPRGRRRRAVELRRRHRRAQGRRGPDASDPQMVQRDDVGRPRRTALRGRRARVARSVGHPPRVSGSNPVSPGSELLRRAGEGPRRRELTADRQHPPLRRRTSRRGRCCCRPTSSWSSTRPTRSLDIFASLLGTSLNSSRIRAFAAVARSLLGADVAPTCLDLDQRGRPTRDDAPAAVRAQRADRSRTRTAHANSGARASSSRASWSRFANSKAPTPTATHARYAPSDPAIHLMNDLERISKVRDGELLYLARRDREVDIEVSLVDVGPRLRDDLWGNVTAVLTSATIPDNLAEGPRARRRRHGRALRQPLRLPGPFDAVRARRLPRRATPRAPKRRSSRSSSSSSAPQGGAPWHSSPTGR